MTSNKGCIALFVMVATALLPGPAWVAPAVR